MNLSTAMGYERLIITYKKDCKNGEIVEIYSNNEKYVGGFYKNTRQGFGKYYFKNGDRYEGQLIYNK